MKLSVICLMGPTASGKTDLAINLATQFPCEIISVDSVMVYQGLDIGSAKPSVLERKNIPHHLIDIVDPACPYSAAQFQQDATAAIKLIHSKGKIPLLVGGTMLYFKVLQQGLSPLPGANQQVRQQLLQEAETIGWQAMHEKLALVDPQSAKRINPNDPQRIQRALEVYQLTQQSLTDLFKQDESQESPFVFHNFGISFEDRAILHERIATRFKQMLQQDFIGEVEQLYQRQDLHEDLPAIRCVGYRQVWQYLAGKLTYEEMLEKGIAATRQLAKRQLTWLRYWPNIVWLSSDDNKMASKLLQYIKNLDTQI